MSEPINLADPSFEPTDEQLAGLMARAFAGVRGARERAMANLRAEIAAARAEAHASSSSAPAIRVPRRARRVGQATRRRRRLD
jgi:hypothetical protein